jgi:hypothetical protein
MAKAPAFTVRPEDIKVSATGEVTIANPDILSKINADLAAASVADLGAAADNYVGCGGNAYQCGTSQLGFDELINQARSIKQSRG